MLLQNEKPFLYLQPLSDKMIVRPEKWQSGRMRQS